MFSCCTSHRNSQELTSHICNTRKILRKSTLSDVPPPDKDVNTLGDVSSILVLANYSAALDRTESFGTIDNSWKIVSYYHTYESSNRHYTMMCPTTMYLSVVRHTCTLYRH